MKKKPIMYVFAGNNGSGKSTVRGMFYDHLGSVINIDPDTLVKKHRNQTTKSPAISAGKEALRIVNDCIKSNIDFSIETTLAGKLSLRQIKQAKAKGFEVVVIYVGTNHVAINLRRIAKRVENGGHDIPKEDVLRRHWVSRENLINHLEVIDNIYLVDNSGKDGELFATIENGAVKKHIHPIVKWGDEILQLIQQKLDQE